MKEHKKLMESFNFFGENSESNSKASSISGFTATLFRDGLLLPSRLFIYSFDDAITLAFEKDIN